jgi:NAD(P)-dependent dehydrogenase (short-subunit alcohol dehydrogenase family)
MTPELHNITVIAIAGGSGHLGRAITEALVAAGKYQVLILARAVSIDSGPCRLAILTSLPQVDEEKAKAIGAPFIAVDYTNADSLVKVLEKNKVDTVISTITSMGDVSAEMSLIHAADRSTATKRYIPSIWGIKMTEE